MSVHPNLDRDRQAAALERIAAALEGQNRAVWNLVRVGACGIVTAEDRHAVLRTANDAAYHANHALRGQDGDDEGDDARQAAARAATEGAE